MFKISDDTQRIVSVVQHRNKTLTFVPHSDPRQRSVLACLEFLARTCWPVILRAFYTIDARP